MTKLTKAQLAERDKVSAALANAYSGLQDAVEAYNEELVEAWINIQAAIDKYNDELAAARVFCHEEIAVEIQDFIDGKSEKWQVGDKGEAYASWKEQWELDLDDVDIDQPDPLDFDVEEHYTLIDDLPTEVE